VSQKIFKTGNSAAVTIPAEFFEALSLKIGDRVEAKMNYRQGTITYIFLNGRQLAFDSSQKRKKERDAK